MGKFYHNKTQLNFLRAKQKRKQLSKTVDLSVKNIQGKLDYVSQGVIKTPFKPKRDNGLNCPKFNTVIRKPDVIVKGVFNPVSFQLETSGFNWCYVNKSIDFFVKAKIRFIQEPLGLHTIKSGENGN